MDGNLWAGKDIIPGDENKQNQNGKLFEQFLIKNPDISVLNALSICEGTITRERRTRKGTEKGILDFFLVCDKILPLVTRMVIDEKGENALCKYRAGNVVKADHHMLKIEINIMFHMKKDHERNEMFNLKDKVCQQQFKLFTTNTKRFTRCFETEEIFDIQFKRWQRQLQKALYANFRKIRIKK